MNGILMNKKVKKMISIIAIILVVIVALKFIMFPPVKTILTTGKYQVASEDYWVNEDKADPYSVDGIFRQLQVRKWYPVD